MPKSMTYHCLPRRWVPDCQTVNKLFADRTVRSARIGRFYRRRFYNMIMHQRYLWRSQDLCYTVFLPICIRLGKVHPLRTIAKYQHKIKENHFLTATRNVHHLNILKSLKMLINLSISKRLPDINNDKCTQMDKKAVLLANRTSPFYGALWCRQTTD